MSQEMERSAELLELAKLNGIRVDYHAFDGSLQEVSADTLVKVLEALGYPASDPEQIRQSLQATHEAQWRDFLPPTVVVQQFDDATIAVHVTDGQSVEIWVDVFGGEKPQPPASQRDHRPLAQLNYYYEPRQIGDRLVGRATFAIPNDLPLGYHLIHAKSGDLQENALLVVTPQQLQLPAEVAAHQVWGLLLQLYSVRSKASWGLGDFADLTDLAHAAARRGGADYLCINPLGAAEPIAPMTPSPYLPDSRRFLNPMYIRIEDVPEVAYLPVGEIDRIAKWAEPVKALNNTSALIDRDAVWGAKKQALEVIFGVPRRPARVEAFRQFVAEQGQGIVDFATWCAIYEYLDGAEFPPELDDVRSEAVAQMREKLADRVQFYLWLQWIADEQKVQAQNVAKTAGMKIGIMHDLAVGVHPAGADFWANRAFLAPGVSVGAPPDMYNQQGQNWSQPPWNPRALEQSGYQAYREMLATIFRGAGALRVDHILGLFRLWWIPEGSGADQGTYVTYNHEALIGIMCLEALRAGAVLVGEDLGTFESWVREYLSDRGVLGTSVEWFEMSDDGKPLPPELYRRLAMATVGTHDLPPTASYLAGEHVELRNSLGLLTEPVETVRLNAQAERELFVTALRARGLVGENPSEREIIEAMHKYLRLSPAALIGVQLVDAVGERQAQNVPGTDQEYPNWKVPLSNELGNPVLIEDLFDSQRFLSLIATLTVPMPK